MFKMLFRRTVLAALLAVAAVIGLTTVPASAATQKEWGYLTWNCSIDGRYYKALVEVRRYTTPGANWEWGSVAYSGNPGGGVPALANRVEWRTYSGAVLFALGGPAGSLDDVPLNVSPVPGSPSQLAPNVGVQLGVWDGSQQQTCTSVGNYTKYGYINV